MQRGRSPRTLTPMRVVRRVLLPVGLVLACGAPATPPADPSPEPPAAAARVVAPDALRAAIAAGVRRRGDNEASFEVDAFLAALVAAEVEGGGGGLRFEPQVEAGRQVGYLLAEVPEGSPYAAIGLRAGDVIEAISGVRLDAPGRAAAALAASERAATIELVRAGVSSTIELRAASGLAWSTLRGGAAPTTGAKGQGPGDLSLDTDYESLPPVPVKVKAGARTPAPPPTPAPPSTPRPAAERGARCSGPGSCTIDRRTFDAALAGPEKVLQQVDITAAPRGYRLTRVAPGSTISQLGFQTGDTLISVNGARLDDDAAALGLYMGLSTTRRFRVAYERGGARAVKTIEVEG